ncbi:MAG: hypothetical protein JNM00_06900 [Flavobacteriales bacterium]|nr:hypothetical protein [Flavobacteriales bacterium]
MIAQFETTWLNIIRQPRPSGRLTDIYFVMTRDEHHKIGEIKWYGAFRQYAFFPEGNTVYEKQCLGDLSKALQMLMDARKKEKKLQNSES